jgi:hypothetical protein
LGRRARTRAPASSRVSPGVRERLRERSVDHLDLRPVYLGHCAAYCDLPGHISAARMHAPAHRRRVSSDISRRLLLPFARGLFRSGTPRSPLYVQKTYPPTGDRSANVFQVDNAYFGPSAQLLGHARQFQLRVFREATRVKAGLHRGALAVCTPAHSPFISDLRGSELVVAAERDYLTRLMPSWSAPRVRCGTHLFFTLVQGGTVAADNGGRMMAGIVRGRLPRRSTNHTAHHGSKKTARTHARTHKHTNTPTHNYPKLKTHKTPGRRGMENVLVRYPDGCAAIPAECVDAVRCCVFRCVAWRAVLCLRC